MKIRATRPFRADAGRLTSVLFATFCCSKQATGPPAQGVRSDNTHCKRAYEMGVTFLAICGSDLPQFLGREYAEGTCLHTQGVQEGYTQGAGQSAFARLCPEEDQSLCSEFHFHSSFPFFIIPKTFLRHLSCNDSIF